MDTTTPTDGIVNKSLEIAAKILTQENEMRLLREVLEGPAAPTCDPMGLNNEIREAERYIAAMERDIVARRIALSAKVQTQGETLTRILEVERLIAQYRIEYKDTIMSALKV